MDTTVTLRHTLHTLPRRIEWFYDGYGVAENGLLTLPATEVEHLRAAYFRGYQLTPEGTLLVGFQGLDEYIERQTAMSAEETDEGDDTGRQPANQDRVRARQRKSRPEASE